MTSFPTLGEAPLGYPISSYDGGTGYLTKTLAGVGRTASGSVSVAGYLSFVLDQTHSVPGIIGQLAPMGARPLGSPYYEVEPVTGYLTVSLAGVVTNLAGGPQTSGALAVQLAGATIAATAALTDGATLLRSTAPVSFISTGQVADAANLTLTLLPTALNGQAGVVIVGALFLTLDIATGSATAQAFDRTANLVATLGPAALAATATPTTGTNLAETTQSAVLSSNGRGAIFRRNEHLMRSRRAA